MRFLRIAYGLSREVETQFLTVERMCYITARQSSDLLALTSEVGKLLNGLINSKRSP